MRIASSSPFDLHLPMNDLPVFPVICLLCAAVLSISAGGCVSEEKPAIPRPQGADLGGQNPGGIRLSPADSNAIGQKIWQNECSGTIEGLTSWNVGEDFASLGIGHFIWYVPGRRGPFEESFPQLINYMKHRRVPMPEWVANARGCPWPDRQAFLAQKNSPQMGQLRQFLSNTVAVQTDFIVQRLEKALPKMVAATSGNANRQRLTNNFYKVAESRQGVYALIDYVNFKGEGVKPEEKYQGQGWGLRDVLLEMRDMGGGPAAAHEFGEAAKRVLQRRVRNSPPDRGESRWLAGWMNRCATYQRSF